MIEVAEDRQPMLCPDGRSLKLFEASIEALDLHGHRREEVLTGLGKHFVEPPNANLQPMPISAIYVLRYHGAAAPTAFERRSMLDSAQTLLNESHRPWIALEMARSGRHVEVSGAVASRVPVFTLQRTRDIAGIDSVARDVLAHWDGLQSRGGERGR